MVTKNNKKSATPRHRNWGLIVYSESAPENWRDILKEEGVPFAYILHDKDTKIDENGEVVLKKPHYHIILKYRNQKSYQQMMVLTGRLRALNPMRIESLVGYARDFLHLDEESKYQFKYHISEVHVFRGFDFQDLVKPNKTELHDILRDIRSIIRNEGITEIKVLYDYLDEINHDYSRVLDSKCYPIDRYISSSRHKPKSNPKDVTPQLKEEIPTSSNMKPNVCSLKKARQIEKNKAFAISQLSEEDYFDLYEVPYFNYSC